MIFRRRVKNICFTRGVWILVERYDKLRYESFSNKYTVDGANNVSKYDAPFEFRLAILDDNQIYEGRIIELARRPVPEGHSRRTFHLLEKESKVLLEDSVSK